jgi:hypothetical protein
MLLKIDAFFFIGFDVQFVVIILLGNSDSSSVYFHLGLSIPATIIALVTAYYAVCH